LQREVQCLAFELADARCRRIFAVLSLARFGLRVGERHRAGDDEVDEMGRASA
jgi:hypothetical protein